MTIDPKLVRSQICALELLDASGRAYRRGLFCASFRFADRAREVSPYTFGFIVRGILAGRIPGLTSDPTGWARYFRAERDRLAGIAHHAERGDP